MQGGGDLGTEILDFNLHILATVTTYYQYSVKEVISEAINT
jgi:hypothetical protein